MRVLLIGDVGVQDGALHAGDEAMLAQTLRRLRDRGMTSAVVVSADPEGTATRYGVEVVAPMGFASSRHDGEREREERLAAIVDTASGVMGRLGDDDPARAVIRAIAQCDLVVVAGAGNLSSLWPQHVFERSAIGHVATVLGRPIVISGQTLGPTLVPADGRRLVDLLQQSSLVGVRERASAELASALGESATRSVDDALDIGLDASIALPPLPERFVSATFAPSTGRWPAGRVVAAIAHLLDGVVERHDLDVVLVPHVAPVDGSVGGDVVVHDAVVAAMAHADRVTSLRAVEPAATGAIAARAAATISTRYHPVVFALAGGRPAVGITTDEYTDAKIRGALENHGLAELAVPVLSLASGDADAVVDAALAIPSEILEERAAEAVATLDAWWDAVADLGETPVFAPAPITVLDPMLAARIASLADWQRAQASELTVPILLAREIAEVERSHALEVDALLHRLGEAQASRVDAELRAREHEEALDAAHDRIAELAEPTIEHMWRETRSRRHVPGQQLQAALDARDGAVAERDRALAEITALHATRTMRWTTGARTAYRRLRER